MTAKPAKEFRVCPYNKSHRVSVSKMGNHKIECQRNYMKEMIKKGKESEAMAEVACRWNPVGHKIPIMEVHYHEQYECQDKNESDKAGVKGVKDGFLKYAPKKTRKQVEKEQRAEPGDWEYNPHHQSFNVNLVMANKFIFRQPPGMSASEKKIFRQAQYEKFHTLELPPGFVVKEMTQERNPFRRVGSMAPSSIGSVYYDAEDEDNNILFSDDEDDEELFFDAKEDDLVGDAQMV